MSDLVAGNGTYVAAMIVLAALALIGFAAALFLPANPLPNAGGDVASPALATPGALDTAV